MLTENDKNYLLMLLNNDETGSFSHALKEITRMIRETRTESVEIPIVMFDQLNIQNPTPCKTCERDKVCESFGELFNTPAPSMFEPNIKISDMRIKIDDPTPAQWDRLGEFFKTVARNAKVEISKEKNVIPKPGKFSWIKNLMVWPD